MSDEEKDNKDIPNEENDENEPNLDSPNEPPNQEENENITNNSKEPQSINTIMQNLDDQELELQQSFTSFPAKSYTPINTIQNSSINDYHQRSNIQTSNLKSMNLTEHSQNNITTQKSWLNNKNYTPQPVSQVTSSNNPNIRFNEQKSKSRTEKEVSALGDKKPTSLVERKDVGMQVGDSLRNFEEPTQKSSMFKGGNKNESGISDGRYIRKAYDTNIEFYKRNIDDLYRKKHKPGIIINKFDYKSKQYMQKTSSEL